MPGRITYWGRDGRCRFVNRVFHNQNELSKLGVIDAHGKLVCTPDPASLGIDVSDREYVHEVLATGQPALSTFVIGRASNQAVIVSARPVVAVDGAIRGVAYAAVRQSALIAAASGGMPGAPVYLIDASGNVLSINATMTPGQAPSIAKGTLVAMAGQLADKAISIRPRSRREPHSYRLSMVRALLGIRIRTISGD